MLFPTKTAYRPMRSCDIELKLSHANKGIESIQFYDAGDQGTTLHNKVAVYNCRVVVDNCHHTLLCTSRSILSICFMLCVCNSGVEPVLQASTCLLCVRATSVLVARRANRQEMGALSFPSLRLMPTMAPFASKLFASKLFQTYLK